MSAIGRVVGFLLRSDSIRLWRSEPMQFIRMILPSESAHEIMLALGKLGVLQFKDLNSRRSVSQRTYANQVKRCDEMERRLRYLEAELQKAGVAIPESESFPDSFDFDAVEESLQQLEDELRQLGAGSEDLRRRRNEVTELEIMLRNAAGLFAPAQQEAVEESAAAGAAGGSAVEAGLEAPLLRARDQRAAVDPLGVIAGLVRLDRVPGLHRLVLRATRGNVFLRTQVVGTVADPVTGETVEKALFLAFYSGAHAKAKVVKICDAFSANRYPLPEEAAARLSLLRDAQQRKAELGMTLEAAEAQRSSTLERLAKQWKRWEAGVHRDEMLINMPRNAGRLHAEQDKEKAVYHTLNKCSGDIARKVLVAEAWCPVSSRAQVSAALQSSIALSSAGSAGSVVQTLTTQDPPPTHFRNDKFTAAFSDIVEAYGVACYQEVNPAVFTMMTFPFLFAVMFGDAGHGILMLFFALWMLRNEARMAKSDLGDIMGMLFGGRYVILLMSIFSIYCGAIYNEFFSMPMTLFGDTKFTCSAGPAIDLRACTNHGGRVVFPAGSRPYPLGVDPVWHGTRSELSYLNSLKMKLSVLLGVIQMNLGILHSLLNHIHFKDTLSIVAEFIPQMLFLNGLFGYLSFMIIYKWITGQLTDLYHVMIIMFLKPGTMDDAARLFPYQEYVQPLLLLVCLVTVPWMLFPKPLVLNARHKAHKAAQQQADGEQHSAYTPLVEAEGEAEGEGHEGGGGHGHGHGEFEFSEVMVHQIIHTIEFVLGAVSNTASYLRLWALSLAHSQLSSVFYDRVLMMTITLDSPLAMYIGFLVFFIATLGVLMVMESLSAFLHALRLHWVEFQNKFYHGDGYKFMPFSFDGTGDMKE